jgi:molybdate transport system permease protein
VNSSRLANLLAALLALVGAGFIALPLAGLVLDAPWSNAWAALSSPPALSALRLSLITSLAATVITVVLGVPLAWVQARARFPGRSLLRGLTLLPLVLPPVVGGVALLYAFGPHGLAGPYLAQRLKVQLPFTTPGVVVAEAFIALPFLVLPVEAGLLSLNRRYEEAGRTLGASRWMIFRRITLPLMAPALVAGTVLAWARALGEFGATITFAGSVPGVTQTMPLSIYALHQTKPEAAAVLSLVLVGVSLVVLITLRDRWLGGQVARLSPRPNPHPRETRSAN